MQYATAYAAHSLAGDTLALEAKRGRVALFHVRAAWCAPCRIGGSAERCA